VAILNTWNGEEVQAMVRASRGEWWLRLSVWAAAVGATGLLWAADPIKGAGKFNPQHESAEVFAAIQAGQVEAQLIPKDSAQVCLLLKNKTAKPLNVELPAALAAVPVLAQFNLPGNPNNQGNNANGPQPLGLGNPGANNPLFNLGNGPGNRGNIFFNIAPEQVAQIRLPAVCLAYGQPEPKPQMTYQLKPLASVTDKPGVQELCAMLARGEVSQRAAQAAAWHLSNEMSWKQLKAERIKIAFGRLSEPYFTDRELTEGQKAANKALEQAKKQKEAAKSPSVSMR
jgi:hypothetical protein